MEDEAISNVNLQQMYHPFSTGVKVWFAICAIAQILSGLVLMVSIGSMGIGNLFLGAMSIVYGAEYAYLLSTRKKEGFSYLTGSAMCFVILYIFFALFKDSSYILSVFSVLINIGITYAILRNYEKEKEVVSVSMTPNSTAPNNSEKNISGGIQCPVCGSNHLQAVSESNTTGGGYNAGNGCCGYILLGPLGILCGACGSKTKTTNRTFFVCMDCGNKFAK
ncbi:MAG: hypothetical protein ACI4CT_09275 [Lachnospiraceae bacterium]